MSDADRAARPMGRGDGPPVWRIREVPLDLWGALVKGEREAQGLSQRALAERIGATQQTISKVELGAHCTHDTLKLALAEALGIEVARLFPWEYAP